jgi:N-acetylmuramoyl-L-alanine amidase
MPCDKRVLAILVAVLFAALAGILAYAGSFYQLAAPQVDSQSPAETPNPAAQKPSQSETHTAPEFLVMIDPAHGGDDRGAALTEKLAEKDVTLLLARRLKTELQEKGIAARLLRDADTTLNLEQRAEIVNAQRGAVYLALHAGTPGGGIRVYSAALPSAPDAASRFLAWDEVQARYLARSRNLARVVAAELGKKDLPVATLSTPLRPLNNIAAPAIAVELASEPEKAQEILGQKFQGTVVAGITSALLQTKTQSERAE